MTKFKKRQQRNERVQIARSEGKCIDCYTNPVGTKKDGLPSVRCDVCRTPISERCSRNGTGNLDRTLPRPKIKYDADGEPDAGWLDSIEFAQYTIMVKKIIDQHKNGIWLGTIYRLFEKRARPEWTPTALRNLLLLNEIEETWGCPIKYVAREFKPKAKSTPYAYNNKPSERASQSIPTALLDQKRVTA